MTKESADKKSMPKRGEILQRAHQTRGADISLEEADPLASVPLHPVRFDCCGRYPRRDKPGCRLTFVRTNDTDGRKAAPTRQSLHPLPS